MSTTAEDRVRKALKGSGWVIVDQEACQRPWEPPPSPAGVKVHSVRNGMIYLIIGELSHMLTPSEAEQLAARLLDEVKALDHMREQRGSG